MFVADLHCDTISELYTKKHGIDGIRQNALQVDIKKMQQGKYILQNFAMFIDMANGENPYECCKGQIAFFLEELKKNQDTICLVKTYKDIEHNVKSGKISAMLTIEEGQAVLGSVKKLEEFYDLGARMMTFTWNYANLLGSPANAIPQQPKEYVREYQGLTDTGIDMLYKMEQLGIIADTAHLSDAGFYDVCRYAKKPFICSHSNARNLCTHSRNLTNEMIHILGERGGVIGVNYYGMFLFDRQVDGCYPSTVKRIAEHILHMIDKGGINCVGLGSDFDGMSGILELENCSKMELLAAELSRQGLHESQTEQVFYKNVLNFYKENLHGDRNCSST